MSTHNAACLEATAQYARFKEAHPGLCPTCGGTGAVYEPGDWVPYGMGNVQTPGHDDVCPACLDATPPHCPRCGHPGLLNIALGGGPNDAPICCPDCGWDERDPARDLLLPPECLCWEDQFTG